MDARALRAVGLVQCALHAVAKRGIAPRQAGQATLTRGPVAWGRIEEHWLQPLLLQAQRQVFGCMFIGEQELDGAKAVLCGRRKAVHKAMLVVKQGEVGGKAWHGGFLDQWCADRGTSCDDKRPFSRSAPPP